MSHNTKIVKEHEQGFDIKQTTNNEYWRGVKEGKKQAMQLVVRRLAIKQANGAKITEELSLSASAVGVMAKIITDVRLGGCQLGEDMAWLAGNFYLGALASGIQLLVVDMATKVDEVDRLLGGLSSAADD